jgi:hypothetical protein
VTATPTVSCVRCHALSEAFTLDGGTTIDLCPRCREAWFDRGELARCLAMPHDLLDAVDDDHPPAAADAPLCPRCEGVCMRTVPYARTQGAPTVLQCPYCEGIATPLTALATMRSLVGARVASRPRAPVALDTAAPRDFVAHYDPDAPPTPPLTTRQRALAVPIAFAVVALLRTTSLGTLFLHGARVALHELGHAVTAWCFTWRALPLPVGVTLTSPGYHIEVQIGVMAATVAGAVLAWRHGGRALSVMLGLYGTTVLLAPWLTSLRTQEAMVAWGGCGGELVLGALLVLSFFYEMPERMRWGRFRWVALAIGACVYVSAALFWREAARDWDLIPWDAALADTGDMSVLRDQHGWSEATITGRYTRLAWVLFALIAGHVAWSLRWRSGGDGGDPRTPPGAA